MVDCAELLHEVLLRFVVEGGPDGVEDGLVAVGDQAGQHGDVVGGDSVPCLEAGVRWQKARAACSTLLKVDWPLKLRERGSTKRSPSNSMVLSSTATSSIMQML